METEKHRPTILIVDDNDVNLSVAKAVLSRFDYHIRAAYSGREALKIIEANPVDLILLDIMMPELDGFQVSAILKAAEKTKDIPIIFLSAKNETEDILQAFNSGGADYLTKPFRKEELIARINTHLEVFLARKKIIRQNEELEKVIRLRDKIYSVIAHDLRAPLSNLKMLSNVINANIEKIEDPDLVQVLEMMDKTIDESFNFLDNLLKWTRQQSGRVVVNRIEFAVTNTIHECISHFFLAARQKNIELVYEKKPSSNTVFGDQDIFKTILRNLLSNAIKFSYKDSRILISENLDDNYLVVSVKDFGTGIQPEDQKKLFDEKAHFTYYGTNQEKGTGLGLLLGFGLARQNHGNLWFKSAPGEGSTFYFSTPLPKT